MSIFVYLRLPSHETVNSNTILCNCLALGCVLYRTITIGANRVAIGKSVGDARAPRAGRQRAAEVLKQVYGGDQEYFRSVSPRRLAEQNAEAIIKGSLVRQVCGDEDETFGQNRIFHEHLERLKIPHTWTVLPGVEHNPMKTLQALGDSNWAFYREAFGDPK